MPIELLGVPEIFILNHSKVSLVDLSQNVCSLTELPSFLLPVQHHHKRSLLPSPSSPSPSASSVFLGLQQQSNSQQHQHQQQQQQKYPQCLQTEYHSSELSFHKGPGWDRRVCSASSLDERVRLLVEGSPCRKHRVCQVSSWRELVVQVQDARRRLV